MTEPDVTLTDYGLAVEAALFAYLLSRPRGPRRPPGPWFVLFFGATAAAALTGGTVHGFFLDAGSFGATILWPATLLAVGLAALAAWGAGAAIQFPAPVARWIWIAAAVEFAGYALVVAIASQAFAVAILNYLPATIFLGVVLALAYRRTRERAPLLGLTGLALTFVASGVQQAKVALHPVYVSHNALHHLIQAVALFLIFLCARWLVVAGAGR